MASLDQLHTALRNADAAGDVQAAQMLAAEIQRMGTPKAAPYDAGADTGPLEAGLIGAGRVFDKGAMGLKQGVLSLTDKLGLGGGDELARMKADEGEKDAAYGQLEKAHPVATFVGEAAPTIAMKNPLMMAATAGASYGTPEERALNAGGAYVGGKAGQALGSFFGRILGGPETMGKATATANNTGNQWGIRTTAGMNSDSKPVQILESVVGNMPFGGAVTKGRETAFKDFNRAVSNSFGESTSELTPDILGASRKNIGGTIGDIAERNVLAPDKQFAQEIAAKSQEAAKDLTGDALKKYQTQLDDLLNHVDPNTGVIEGTFYKSLDSKLGRMAKGTQDGDLAHHLAELRSTMRSGFDRSISANDSADWQLARKQYANLMTVADAAKNTGDGSLSPARLLQAVNTNQPNAKFGSGTDLAELAQFGKAKLPDKIPNSGTAQRALYQNLINNPVSGLAAAGGIGYGADKAGLGGPEAGAAALLPFLLGRGMAGKPTSAATKSILRTGGAGLSAVGGMSLAERLAQALRERETEQ